VYVLIEMEDVELKGVQLFVDGVTAQQVFKELAQENRAAEVSPVDLQHELMGTLRLAGDHVYSVQLLSLTPRR